MNDGQFEFLDSNGFLWKDAATHPQQSRNRNPTAYEVVLHFRRQIRIYITVGHIHYRGEWVLRCFALGIDSPRVLKAKTREDAADEAIKECREIVDDFVRMLKVKPL